MRGPPLGVVERLGVGHDHVGSARGQLLCHVERRRVPHVVAVGLEGGAEDGDPRAGDRRPVQHLDGEVDHALTPPLVDRVDLAEEADRGLGMQLLRPGDEGSDVLRQAPASEAKAGVERSASDPLVEADGVGQQGHVASGHLAQLGHRVDEGDLGGQERVRGHLDQLRRGVVHDETGHPSGEDRRVDLVQHGDRGMALVAAVDPVYQPVRLEGVAHREPLPEELGVPRQLLPGRGQHRGEPGGCPHRDGGLPDHQTAGPGDPRNGGNGVIDESDVGGIRVGSLRRGDADEVDVCVRDGLDVGAEGQPPCREGLPEQLGEAGLVERRLGAGQHRHLEGIGVHPHHLVADGRHRRCVNRPQIAATDHRYTHEQHSLAL